MTEGKEKKCRMEGDKEICEDEKSQEKVEEKTEKREQKEKCEIMTDSTTKKKLRVCTKGGKISTAQEINAEYQA